jgi:hypothetical protein
MSVRKVPMPPWRAGVMGRPGWCKWCDEAILDPLSGRPHRQRMWHQHCADEYLLHTRAEQQRAFLIRRDGQQCAHPSCGVVNPERWVGGAVYAKLTWASHRRLFTDLGSAEWLDQLWERPEDAPWADFARGGPLHGLGDTQDIERVTALQVDHKTPLWSVDPSLAWPERRWFWGPGNLWLLCPDCHKAKTAREAGERARARCRPRAQPGLPLTGGHIAR